MLSVHPSNRNKWHLWFQEYFRLSLLKWSLADWFLPHLQQLMSTLLAQRHLQQQSWPRGHKSGQSKWISQNLPFSLDNCGFAHSTLPVVGLRSRCGWRHGGSSLMGMCWNWLGSPAQHSRLDHQRVAAQSCRTLTYSEAVWHIKSGRQGVSQPGRQPRLHNNDLRRSPDGKFFKQTRTSLSTSGFGALWPREWGLFWWQFLKKAAAAAFRHSAAGEGVQTFFTCSSTGSLLWDVEPSKDLF